MNAQFTIPYWLTEGTEECAVCEHYYVLEMEFRCSECDRGVCGQCAVVVHETHIVYCFDCDPERES